MPITLLKYLLKVDTELNPLISATSVMLILPVSVIFSNIRQDSSTLNLLM